MTERWLQRAGELDVDSDTVAATMDRAESARSQAVPGEGLEPSRPEGPAGLSRDLGFQGARWILRRAL